MKKILKYSAVFLSALMLISFMCLTVFAEPEDESQPSSSDTFEEPTEEIPQETETDPPEEPTPPPNDQTDPPASDPTDPEPASEETEPNEETSEELPAAPSDPQEPSYNVDDLPPVEENEFLVPTSIVEEAPPQTATVAAGIISWLCVAIGIIVIIAVLGSSKTRNYMNDGKQRYESGDIISGGKRR